MYVVAVYLRLGRETRKLDVALVLMAVMVQWVGCVAQWQNVGL